MNGADLWLKEFDKLPPYYISEGEALELGWKNWLGNLSSVAPGKMLTKGVYKNRGGHLPASEGRIWYEADINYAGGFRGNSRILFSNDSLIFVTYDHYQTFSHQRNLWFPRILWNELGCHVGLHRRIFLPGYLPHH